MKNFAITSLWRSGTLFLAENMNLSKKWTVIHEAGGYGDLHKTPPQIIQKRFNRNYYGEANGYLRHCILKLDLSRKCIILRDPTEVWLSMSNRKKPDQWSGVISELDQSYNEFIGYEQSGIKFFLFDHMILDLEYLKSIFNYVGVNDVEVTKEMQMKKININDNIKYHKLDEFDSTIQDRILKIKDTYMRLKDVIQ